MTLPDDVLESLRALHPDPAWAVVQLVESTFSDRTVARQSPAPPAIAELVHLPGKRGLIVVQTGVFKRLQGISTIPLADGRAFLAFDKPAGIADLEVGILDKLEGLPTSGTERARLADILDTVRSWRRDRGLVFRTKSIIVVESSGRLESRSLGPPVGGRPATKDGTSLASRAAVRIV